MQSLVTFKWTDRLEWEEDQGERRGVGAREVGKGREAAAHERYTRTHTYTHTYTHKSPLLGGLGTGCVLRSCQPPSTAVLKDTYSKQVCVCVCHAISMGK